MARESGSSVCERVLSWDPGGFPSYPAPELSLHALRQNWPELWDGYRRLLEDLPETGLAVELTTQLPGGIEPRFSRWQILRHVLEHSTMHRGQVVGMIRTLGRQPPAINRMDYYLSVLESSSLL